MVVVTVVVVVVVVVVSLAFAFRYFSFSFLLCLLSSDVVDALVDVANLLTWEVRVVVGKEAVDHLTLQAKYDVEEPEVVDVAVLVHGGCLSLYSP